MCLSPWFRSASDDQNLIQHILRPVSESVWIGEAQAVEERLRGGAVTVRAFLRERYVVMAGRSERGDRSDFKRFRLWLADARQRVRRVRAEEKRPEQRRRVTAWKAESAMVL